MVDEVKVTTDTPVRRWTRRGIIGALLFLGGYLLMNGSGKIDIPSRNIHFEWGQPITEVKPK